MLPAPSAPLRRGLFSCRLGGGGRQPVPPIRLRGVAVRASYRPIGATPLGRLVMLRVPPLRGPRGAVVHWHRIAAGRPRSPPGPAGRVRRGFSPAPIVRASVRPRASRFPVPAIRLGPLNSRASARLSRPRFRHARARYSFDAEGRRLCRGARSRRRSFPAALRKSPHKARACHRAKIFRAGAGTGPCPRIRRKLSHKARANPQGAGRP